MTTSRPLIAVVGHATVERHSEHDRVAEEIGRRLIDGRYRLLTGGLGGVMESASRGGRSSPQHKDGDIVGLLPGHDATAANPFVDVVIASGLDHGRNLLVAHADAVIAVGGGAGTLSEIAFAWIYRRLIIAMRVSGWSGMLADTRIDERVRYPSIPDDRVFGADEPTDAIAILESRLAAFNGGHRGIG